jgi:hypothetical protein
MLANSWTGGRLAIARVRCGGRRAWWCDRAHRVGDAAASTCAVSAIGDHTSYCCARPLSATMRATDSCARKGREPSRPFFVCARRVRIRSREGERDDDGGDSTACAPKELPALQSRDNGRDGALPPLPLQIADAHAPATRRNRKTRGMGGLRCLTRRRELLRYSLSLDSRVRRRTPGRGVIGVRVRDST